ncbi:MAG: 50S ribosomal protein L3 [Candidatus Omnitrophica bacterium]|nr:50S ribosomal protein L3 [Candidatus Omnitrophota bacterium]MBU4487527.1 50S ribosomal protein L3 [Candidatus Omnitrophota bacterium]
MANGILGKKIGQTQLYTEGGALVSVTVIEAGPCTILQVKEPAKDKYMAIKLGFENKREKNTNKPDMGNFKKVNSAPKRFVREIRVASLEGYNAGDEIKVDIFHKGGFVDIVGTSKGKGFQGGMKRWNWHGSWGGHGSMHHRRVGSIGASSFPSRVVKGHHMPGHMGNERVTIQNLEVIEVDTDKNLLVVKGTVPGHNNSFLTIRQSKKKTGTAKSGPAQAAAKAKKETKAKKGPAAPKAAPKK